MEKLAVEHVLCETGWQIFGHVTSGLGFRARLASVHGEARFSSMSQKIAREVKMKEFVAEKFTLGDDGDGPSAGALNDPVKSRGNSVFKTVSLAALSAPQRMVHKLLWT